MRPSTATATKPDSHVVFYDSSDDDNSHEANISILSEASSSTSRTTPSQEAQSVTQRYKGVLLRGARSVLRMLSHNPHSGTAKSNEPITPESESQEQDRSLAYGASQFRDEPLENFDEVSAATELDEEVGVDLRETILQYQRTPDDFYLNIILAALKSGVIVDGALISAASGCPTIIKILMDSEGIYPEDEELQILIQEEIDRILRGDPYKGEFIPACEADYLYSLCRLPTTRVNMRQMVLMRYSGFAFIEIIVDFPHLLQDATSPKSWQIRLFRFGYIFHTVILSLSWIPTLLLNPIIFLICVYWFLDDERNNGYWTILCYFVGFMACIITTIRSQQTKIKVYPRSTSWGYPDNYYVMFPIIPLYKIVLAVYGVKYHRLPDNGRYLIIRHDLSGEFSIQQMAEGLYAATPQLVLQLFLYSNVNPSTELKILMFCLVGVASVSAFCGICSYVRYAIYSHSCDTFGFALLTVEDYFVRKRGLVIPILPTNIITRLVQFFTMAFCVTTFVTMLVQVVIVKDCGKSVVVVLTAVTLLSTLITSIVEILVIINLSFSRLNALVALPVTLVFGAYLVYHVVSFTKPSHCSAYEVSLLPTWHFPMLICFGFLCILLVGWVVTTIVEVVRTKRLLQRSVDSCFWQTCR